METLPESRAVVVVVASVHCLDLYKIHVLYSAASCRCSRSKSQLVRPCDAADFSENAGGYYCLKYVATLNVEIIGNHVSVKHSRAKNKNILKLMDFLSFWLPLIYPLKLDLDCKMPIAGGLEKAEQLLKPETASGAGMMDASTEATPPTHEAGATGTVGDEGVERGHTSNPELRSQREEPLGLRGPRGEGKLHDLTVCDVLSWKETKLNFSPHSCDVTTWERNLSASSCCCWSPLTSHAHSLISLNLSGTRNTWAALRDDASSLSRTGKTLAAPRDAASTTPKLRTKVSIIISIMRGHRGRDLVDEAGNTGMELPLLLQGNVEVVLWTKRVKLGNHSTEANVKITSFSASRSAASLSRLDSLWMSVSKNLKTQGTQDRRDSITKERTLSRKPSSLSKESSAPARALWSGLQAVTNRFQSGRESRNLPRISWHLALLSRGSTFDITLNTPVQLGTEAAPTPPGQYGICHDEIPQNSKGLNLSQWGELQLPTATSQSDIGGAKSIRALIEKSRAPSSRKILAS